MAKRKPVLVSALPNGGGVTPDFKWWGLSKDFSGFEIFDCGIFWGRFRKYFFGWIDFTKDFFGYSNNLNIFVVVPTFPRN